jgi:transposase
VTLPDTLSLFSELMELKNEYAGLKLLMDRKNEQELLYQGEIEWLKEQLLRLQRDKFGPRKERWQSEEQNVLLFNEAEVEAAKPDDDCLEDSDPTITVESFARKRGKRKALPSHLPREIVNVELPADERFDAEGRPLKVVGKQVSEKFVFEPAVMKVIEYHRFRYGVDAGEPIKTALPVPMIIPKGIVTPSLLSDIVTKKYADGLPLYRQEEIWQRQDVHLSRSSMGRWIVQAATACIPVWNVLEEWLLIDPYVSCDETHTQVLKEKDRKPENKSWMWVRATPGRANPIVLFDYDPHRSGEVAKRLLADYRGFLQADAYGAYNPIEKQDGVTRIGCNMHGRRGFSDADKGAKAGRSLAAVMLKYYDQLYDIEEKAKQQGLSWPERKILRDREAAPIWDEMKIWSEKTITQVPNKSLIGQALGYFVEQYDLLRGYLQDGMLEMDNGFAERAIRKFAIGRNNWMFSDTPEGAHASALFYSFVVTAKLNGVNPYQALKTIFEKIPTASSVEDYEALANLLLSPEKSN